ncbi:MAG: heavy metal translocating P-type ATPase metal-binding domain-containing protein, partial [Opitutaceae bacterium]|nr:heavy metal translocating P-type ATPase metal-binding domain-containing protein [Opitutaceae bacterium]
MSGRKRPGCRHCGAPLADPVTQDGEFCCAGCAYVHRLVYENGFESYYRLKDDLTPPVDAAVFQPRDYDWLRDLQCAAEASGETVPRVVLGIQGISCAGCVWLIEKIFEKYPGARRINVNAQLGEMELSWNAREFSLADFARRLHAFNYLVGPRDPAAVEPESRGLVRRIGLAAAFALNVMLFTVPTYFGMEPTFAYARLFGTLSLVFGTLAMLAGGGYFMHRAWQCLRCGVLHIDLPISLGLVGAYAGSLYGWLAGDERYVYFDFVATFIVLMLTGRWAQVVAVERNQRRLLALQPRPQQVAVLQNGGEWQNLASEQLVAGQLLKLRPGQILPVEADLQDSPAEFSLASINGEASPRAFSVGARVPAGAVALSRHPVCLRTRQAWSDSLLAQLTARHDVEAPRNAFLERIVQGYLIAILTVAFLAGLGWAWFS